jgi:hypothetical protein
LIRICGEALLSRTAEAEAEGTLSLERGTGQVVQANGAAIDKLVAGEIAAVRASLEMLADINMAGAVLIEAANLQDPALVVTMSERFQGIARHLTAGLKQLPPSPEMDEIGILVDALLDYGRGVDDLFVMRRKELSDTTLPEMDRRILGDRRQGILRDMAGLRDQLVSLLSQPADDSAFKLVMGNPDGSYRVSG